MKQDHAQLGFESLLTAAAETNRRREEERATAHLPGTMEEGLAFFRVLIRQHHAAMLAADVDTVIALREEAARLALKLNGGEPGIIADDDAPGCVLARAAAAAAGTAPLWGQRGSFTINVQGIAMAVAIDGMYGLASRFLYWPRFSVEAVDRDRPFISDTGYRSFFGIGAEAVPDLMPDAFVEKVVAAHIAAELEGRLVPVAPRYREEDGP